MTERVSLQLSDELEAPPETVWAALTDAATARAALPDGDNPAANEATPAADGGNPAVSLFEADESGVEERTLDPGDALTVALSLAPGTGTDVNVDAPFETAVRVEEARYPTLVVNGKGETADESASFDALAGVELSETDAGTEVTWAAEAEIEGALAAAGPTAVTPVIAHVAIRFFDDLERLLREAEHAGGDGESG
ncbi:hypothetical protein JCM17823_28230 [Halorubrum gandharaense]